ncbi:MAG: C-terminal binding protein [Chloroflexi bacterium]|nr:C-terminal binding protein [Chloroflexota bacterium]
MSYQVVNTFYTPNTDFGENLLVPLGAALANGHWTKEEEIVASAVDADAVIGSGSLQPYTRRVLGSLPRCRIIASQGIGYDRVDVEAATQLGIVVTNVPDYCLDEVSSRAIALMLALNHKIILLNQAVKEKQVCFVLNRQALWEIATPIFRMRDQTLGIIGMGKIGTATALKARGLGMQVVAYDPYVFKGVIESHATRPVDLDTLLRESDYVSIHTPLTSETSGIIGYEQARKMKRTAYLINTARGGCVDEPGLILALQEGLIAGAGLDVTAKEPIEPDNPLLGMPNVILTGHSAGYSETAAPELFHRPMTQVVMALRGEWPLYVVNPDVKKLWLDKWGKGAR